MKLEGLEKYMRALGIGHQCDYLHDDAFTADLGDGRRRQPPLREFRPVISQVLGICQEPIQPGIHVRAWQQTTTEACFLSASITDDGGNLMVDGFNRGM